MINEKQILTIKDFHQTNLKVKNSLFTSQAFPIEIENDFRQILSAVKKKYYNASHHCYAFKLNENIKYSDDGEPSGSAGIRLLNCIDHFKLTNILVVVIRYFGGAKLGVGLLGKTYYDSAFKTLSEAEKIIKYSFVKIKFIIDYEFVSGAHTFLSNINAKVHSINYADKAEFICFVKPDSIEPLEQNLNDASRGSIRFSIYDEIKYMTE